MSIKASGAVHRPSGGGNEAEPEKNLFWGHRVPWGHRLCGRHRAEGRAGVHSETVQPSGGSSPCCLALKPPAAPSRPSPRSGGEGPASVPKRQLRGHGRDSDSPCLAWERGEGQGPVFKEHRGSMATPSPLPRRSSLQDTLLSFHHLSVCPSALPDSLLPYIRGLQPLPPLGQRRRQKGG